MSAQSLENFLSAAGQNISAFAVRQRCTGSPWQNGGVPADGFREQKLGRLRKTPSPRRVARLTPWHGNRYQRRNDKNLVSLA